MGHKEVVNEYIEGVLAGTIVTGRLVKLAVRRHKEEYDIQAREGSVRGYHFDDEIAEKACWFFPNVLRHSIGKWNNQPFELSGWQAFVVWCLFGWRNEQGFRRFRKAYISVGRKNGKSTLIAGLAVLLLAADIPPEPGAQIYAAATKEEQARIILDEAKALIERSASKSLKKSCEPNVKQITIAKTRSFIRVLGSDSKTNAGWNPHAMLIDELHDWQAHHSGTWDALTTASGSREQPIRIAITTAGDDDSLIWQHEDEFAIKVLESVTTGKVVDDIVFAFIARIDDARPCEDCDGQGCDLCKNGMLPEDDPMDSTCWAKANPNLGESIQMSYLEEQANEAHHKPSSLSSFIRFHCNRRCSSNERAIHMDLWKRCNGPLCEEWEASESYGAFDLGRKSDLASIAVACKFSDGEDANGKERFRTELRQWSFTHEKVDLPLHQEPWATFIRNDRLFVNSGNVIDLPGAFKSKLLEVTKEFNVVQWAYDPNNAAYLALELLDEFGEDFCFEFRQSHGMYNETLEEFLNAVKTASLRHGDDELLTFAAQNLVINKNSKNEWMPKKDSSTGKIDPIVAAIMAFGGAMKNEVKSNYWNPRIGV